MIVHLSRQKSNRIVCNVRVKTFKKIEDSLEVLSKAGFFKFYDESIEYNDNDSKVLRIHLNRITDSFIEIAASMDVADSKTGH